MMNPDPRVDISAHVPQLRPHNRRHDGKVFFLISRRPLLELSGEDSLLYDSIDGCKTVAELEEEHPGASDRLRRWHQAAILELIPPVTPPERPHLVVIEPHMDDAALSAGGRLLHRRGRCRITILSVVRWSNFTTYLELKRDFLDVGEITELRQQESALVARLLGAEFRCLDWPDAPIRFYPAERWTPATVDRFNAEGEYFVNRIPNPKEVSLLAAELTRTLGILAPDELWIPMGLGEHFDHRTTRSACLLMLAEARDRFSHVPTFMYADAPYALVGDSGAQIRATLAEGGTRLVRETEDITDVFEEKLRLISVYGSQFKLSYMEPRMRRLAEREGGAGGKLAEAYHRIEGKPCHALESRLSDDWAGLAALRPEVPAFLAKREKRRHLTVVALPSGNLMRWKTDRETLGKVFPKADLRVYASEDVAWQAEETGDDPPRLRVVRHGWRGWISAIWHELFHFRTPTVVLWWGAYGAGIKRKLIRWSLPFRHVVFAKSLSDLCCVLNELVEVHRDLGA